MRIALSRNGNPTRRAGPPRGTSALPQVEEVLLCLGAMALCLTDVEALLDRIEADGRGEGA